MAARFTSPFPYQDARLSHVVVRRRASGHPARMAWAIRAARAWLGPEVAPAPAGMRRHQVDLRLRLGDRQPLVTFRKAAYVDVGPATPIGEDAWEVEIGWRASTAAPLFPVFFGTVVMRGDELTLRGWYAPPGGALGRAADRALLHIAAEGTARWLLDQLDHAASTGPV